MEQHLPAGEPPAPVDAHTGSDLDLDLTSGPDGVVDPHLADVLGGEDPDPWFAADADPPD